VFLRHAANPLVRFDAHGGVVLNSEVEKILSGILPGAPPRSKCALQFSANTPYLRDVATNRRTADPENTETFATSIGTFRKKG
jgi:hypothetical protein